MSLELNLIVPANGDELQQARFQSLFTALLPPDTVFHIFKLNVSEKAITCADAANLKGRPTVILDPFAKGPTDEQASPLQRIIANCGRVVALTFIEKGCTSEFKALKRSTWDHLFKGKDYLYLAKGEGDLSKRIASALRQFLRPSVKLPMPAPEIPAVAKAQAPVPAVAKAPAALVPAPRPAAPKSVDAIRKNFWKEMRMPLLGLSIVVLVALVARKLLAR